MIEIASVMAKLPIVIDGGIGFDELELTVCVPTALCFLALIPREYPLYCLKGAYFFDI